MSDKRIKNLVGHVVERLLELSLSDGSPDPVIIWGQAWFGLGGCLKYFYMCICRRFGVFLFLCLFLFLEIK